VLLMPGFFFSYRAVCRLSRFWKFALLNRPTVLLPVAREAYSPSYHHGVRIHASQTRLGLREDEIQRSEIGAAITSRNTALALLSETRQRQPQMPCIHWKAIQRSASLLIISRLLWFGASRSVTQRLGYGPYLTTFRRDKGFFGARRHRRYRACPGLDDAR
jgi:hypothetical protein